MLMILSLVSDTRYFATARPMSAVQTMGNFLSTVWTEGKMPFSLARPTSGCQFSIKLRRSCKLTRLDELPIRLLIILDEGK